MDSPLVRPRIGTVRLLCMGYLKTGVRLSRRDERTGSGGLSSFMYVQSEKEGYVCMKRSRGPTYVTTRGYGYPGTTAIRRPGCVAWHVWSRSVVHNSGYAVQAGRTGRPLLLHRFTLTCPLGEFPVLGPPKMLSRE